MKKVKTNQPVSTSTSATSALTGAMKMRFVLMNREVISAGVRPVTMATDSAVRVSFSFINELSHPFLEMIHFLRFLIQKKLSVLASVVLPTRSVSRTIKGMRNANVFLDMRKSVISASQSVHLSRQTADKKRNVTLMLNARTVAKRTGIYADVSVVFKETDSLAQGYQVTI